MNWEMFFSGIAMLVIAYFWRRLSLWAYGKDGEEQDFYHSSKKIVDWVGIVMWVLGGLIVILVSFAPNNN